MKAGRDVMKKSLSAPSRDAVTTATFTIGKDALQRAYSTIPDLRSTQMFFGLSVDLEWKAGLNFNVIID